MHRRRPPHIFALLPIALLGGCAVMPQPLAPDALGGWSAANVVRATELSAPIAGQLTLYDAVARALKYNLDERVALYEVALRTNESTFASTQMLPQLVARAGYIARDNTLAIGNTDLPTGILSSPEKTSADRQYQTADVELSWHVLDFALSYVRARQASDRVLISKENARKVAQRIIADTRTAYWRAVACERLVKKLNQLERRARRSIQSTRAAARAGAESPMTALAYERELVQIGQTAERIKHELQLARAQLAALMNVPHGTDFKLADHDYRPDPGVHGLDPRELVVEAVYNRPEIREIAYQHRISEQDATAAILDTLPGLRLRGARYHDDTSFLLHDNWLGWGAAASVNLFKLLSLPQRMATAEAEAEFHKARALATTMAVMTQVYASKTRYRNAIEEVETAREYRDVQRSLVSQIRNQRDADLVGEQTLIREELNMVIAEVQHDLAVGSLQNASSNLMITLGYDLQGPGLDLNQDVKVIADHLRHAWHHRTVVSEYARFEREIAIAREEARKRAEALERARKLEEKRLAAEAARAKAEEQRLAKAEAEQARKRRIKEAADERRKLQDKAAEARAQTRPSNSRRPVKRKVGPAQPAAPTPWFWPFDTAINAPDQRAEPKSQKRVYTGSK